MKKRVLAIWMILLALWVPALSEATEGSDEILHAVPEFVMMGLESDEQDRKWEDSLFFDRMEAVTGVGFSFRQYSDADAYGAAKAEALAGEGELPDVLFKAYLTPEEEMAGVASGTLVDLAPLLEAHMPNLFAILEAREDWRDSITQPDGSIASLPILSGAERQCCVWINSAWLETLGLDMPDTVEALTQALRAFRDGDPNQNGKRDEVPLSIVGPWEAKYMLHAWGLTPNDYNIYVDDGGTVRFAPQEAEYREFIQWLCLLQEEALINADAFTTTQTTRSTLLSANANQDTDTTVGTLVSIAPYTVVNMDKTTEYAVLPPIAHEGRQTYRQLLNGVGRGTFAVTSACEDVPAVLRWADYLYTEEGGRLAFAGEEGTDYILASDGSWKWSISDGYMDLTSLINTRLIAGDTVTPGLEPAAFMRRTEIQADNYTRRQVDTLREYFVEAFPVTWPTDAAREARIAELQEALGPCVDTAIANFTLGKTPLDDVGWEAFQQELREAGVEEFVQLWQGKYDER